MSLYHESVAIVAVAAAVLAAAGFSEFVAARIHSGSERRIASTKFLWLARISGLLMIVMWLTFSVSMTWVELPVMSGAEPATHYPLAQDSWVLVVAAVGGGLFAGGYLCAVATTGARRPLIARTMTIAGVGLLVVAVALIAVLPFVYEVHWTWESLLASDDLWRCTPEGIRKIGFVECDLTPETEPLLMRILWPGALGSKPAGDGVYYY